ncbi:MAG: M42 family metallopeptidase [Candidatus Cloacimonetes bacterium]|jgi:tetrahedral aminopeptidase|nr:M42 family metallopeptidase [Candidatus Cloacimonadota bacterium]MBT4333592.1 M42 family metallopeptidase [Candidatus Cloacimonadota bacterium]
MEKKFFKDLVMAPSPSGFEQPAQEVYRNFVKEYADDIKTDVHGNVIALKKGTGKLRFMVSGHADEIGLMVNYIDNDGFIRFTSIGGVDATLLPGLRVNVYHNKKVVRGIIGRKPIHLMSPEDRKSTPKMSDLWIDIGAKDKKAAEKRVCVGDHATFSPGLETLSGSIITTKATDNKAGVYIAGLLLKELSGEKIAANVYSVSSVQEEVGLRGARTSAFGIDPHVGIAIDVTHATDYPGMNKNQLGDVALEKGPTIAVGANINPKVFELLKKAGDNAKVTYQIEAAPRGTGTDANAIQVNRSGVAAGLISIPNRYMHTPNEVISFKDLDGAVKLLSEFARLIDDNTDFIPKV